VIWCFQTVFDEQVQVVPLVEDLAVDRRMMLLEEPNLAVLLGDQLLVHGRYFDVQILIGQEEVGGEVRRRLTVRVEFDGEGSRFVLPLQAVEVEE
jgi:beta-galactosidase beta subunit